MYLITGGSGFCGWVIVKRLLRQGEKVRVLDTVPLPEPLPAVDFLKGDIRDSRSVDQACQGVRHVIHAAAKVPISKAGKDFWTVNVDGTRQVLASALRHSVRKVVYLSTSAVMAFNPCPVDEDAPPHPVGPYAQSKQESENVCREFMAKGLRMDIVRPRTVIGPGRLGIFSILFDWISKGMNVFVIGDGRNKLQFLHSEDLAELCVRASQSPGSDVFNVGSRAFGTLREDLQDLLRYADTGSKIVSLPRPAVVWTLRLLEGLRLSPLTAFHYLSYGEDLYFNNQRAKEKLGWEPRHANREILQEAYDWFLRTGRHASSYGTTHRQSLKQGLLRLLNKLI